MERAKRRRPGGGPGPYVAVVQDGRAVYVEVTAKRRKELRARVMSLEQDIKGGFAKIDDFGKRAETKFSREEAKVKTGKH